MVLLMVQGAAAYHFGYNASVFLIDRTTRGDDPMVKADEPLADVVNQPDDDLTDEAEDTPRIRGLGLMHDPNDLAMGMIAALGLIGGAWRARAQLRHVVYAGMAAALVYGVYLTRSRGGALALVVVFWRFAASRFGRVPAVVVLVALCAGAMAVDFGGRSLSMEPDESASGRLLAWREGLEMLKSAPMLGVGYGQFEDHHNLTAHNSLVLCFAETGLLGCFFWVAIIVVTMIELQQVKSLPGDDGFDDTAKRWAEGLELSLVGLLTAAFFLSRTFVPTLYLVVGLAAALAAIVRAADRPLPLPALPTLGLVVLASEAGGIAFVYAIVKLHLA
jgi:O-antigen ligase